jgi:hypothetical protein
VNICQEAVTCPQTHILSTAANKCYVKHHQPNKIIKKKEEEKKSNRKKPNKYKISRKSSQQPNAILINTRAVVQAIPQKANTNRRTS